MTAGAVLGGHLAHVVVFGAFGFSILVALVWPTGPRQVRDDVDALDIPRPPPAEVARRGALLQGAFLGLCAAAAVHLAVLPAHLRESAVLGSFFAVAAAAQGVLAALLLVRPSRRLLAGVAGGSIAVMALWAATRLATLPFALDGARPEAVGLLDVLASGAELTTAVCALALLAGQGRRRPTGVALRPAWRWSGWSLPLRIALLAVSIGVPWTAALAPRG